MNATDIALLALLVTALVFSIIELGLTAYFVSVVRSYGSYDYVDPITGIEYSGRASTPSVISFLVFCSVWSLLVSALLLALGFIKSLKMNDKILGFGSLVLNTITMIFWLAGFAAYVSYFGVGNYIDIPGAVLAFSVMPWLIFLALMILNFLTVFGVLKSGRPGHGRLYGHGTTSTAPQSTPMTTYGASTTAPAAPTEQYPVNTAAHGPTANYSADKA